jgi:hypothetical protein
MGKAAASSNERDCGLRKTVLSSVNRGIESPERYILQISWEKLEDHTEAFRQGPLFSEWHAIVGPFAVAPPAAEHFEMVS